ncbi:hypothetical protein RB597_007703 [Gaeumannomyces tritici]
MHFFNRFRQGKKNPPKKRPRQVMDTELSQMTQKWSSRPKEQDAARVRENQRRHRARTKAHVADLERRLAEATAQLDEALARNAALAMEIQRLQHNKPAVAADEGDGRGDGDTPVRGDAGVGADEVADAKPARRRAAQGSLAVAAAPSRPPTGSPPGGTGADSCPGLLEQPDDSLVFPPAGPGESTIPCARALEILAGQNYDRHDLEAFGGFLRPGYRRAAAEGGGCRVESSRVFAVMDAIQSYP